MRPQTYEDKLEAELLVSLFPGRDRNLENTVFSVLSPGAEKQLCKSGRSPSMTFGDVDSFQTFLEGTFDDYKKAAKSIERLPVLDEFALALNVASCDSLPLVVLHAKTDRDLEKLQGRMAKLSWSKDFIGKQHYFAFVGDELPGAGDEDERNPVADFDFELGITILEPGPFGLTAKVLGHAKPSASSKDLGHALAAALEQHAPDAKVRRDHVRDAKRQDIEWESELPVTDSKVERKSKEDKRK